MSCLQKAVRSIYAVCEYEMNELLKWASNQTRHENQFTMSAWVPRHLRGLMKLIDDLRMGEGRSAQNGRRMQEEISKIDRAIAKGLTPYERRKSIAKVTYMWLFGADAPLGYQEGLRLMASDSVWDKQIGYLYISLVLDNKPDLQRLVVQCLQNDLLQHRFAEPSVHQLALGLVAQFKNPEVALHILPCIEKFLTSTETVPGTQQSALVCMEVLICLTPDSIPTKGEWLQQVFGWLETASADNAKCILSFVRVLIAAKSKEYSSCIPKLLLLLQDNVARLQKDCSSTNGFSRLSPAGLVELLRTFENVPLSNEEELVLTNTIHDLLLYCATMRIVPRFKLITDELESRFHESLMFGAKYDWLKQAPSFIPEIIIFPALCVLFNRGATTESLEEGLDYYARYIRDQREIVRRCAVSEVLKILTTERGFESLKSQDRWSVAILMERVKDESVLDIRDDICHISFLLTVSEDEASTLCQTALEYLRTHLTGLNIRRLSENFTLLFERSLIPFSKFVYTVIELTDFAANQVCAKAYHVVVTGMLGAGTSDSFRVSISMLLEEKLSHSSSDALVQFAVIIIGAFHNVSQFHRERHPDDLVHLFSDLCEQPFLNLVTKGYLILHLALLGSSIGALPVREKIITTLKRSLDKPKMSKEFQAYQNFMLLDDSVAPVDQQLQALRFIAASIDNAVEVTPTISRPHPRSKFSVIDARCSKSSSSEGRSNAQRNEEMKSWLSSIRTCAKGIAESQISPASSVVSVSLVDSAFPGELLQLVQTEAPLEFTSPWIPTDSNKIDAFAMPVWSQSSDLSNSLCVDDHVEVNRHSNAQLLPTGVDSTPSLGTEIMQLIQCNAAFTPQSQSSVGKEPWKDESVSETILDPYLPVIPKSGDEFSLMITESDLLDVDSPRNHTANVRKVSASQPGSTNPTQADQIKAQPKPPRPAWTFGNPWNQFDLGSVVQSLNLTADKPTKDKEKKQDKI